MLANAAGTALRQANAVLKVFSQKGSGPFEDKLR